MVKGWMSIMDTRLGKSKIYFKAQDFGKMLKLKDVENLVITNVNVKDAKEVEVEIATPICNATNKRVSKLPFEADVPRQSFDNKENNKEIHHVGLIYERNILYVVILEEDNSKKILKSFFVIEGKIGEVIDNLIKQLSGNDVKFYVDNVAFGSMVRDILISKGVAENKVFIKSIREALRKRRIKDILKINTSDLNIYDIRKLNTILEVILEEDVIQSPSANGFTYIRKTDNQFIGWVEAFILPLI